MPRNAEQHPLPTSPRNATAGSSLRPVCIALTVAADDHLLAAEHNIRASLDAIDDRLSAEVQVVEFGLRHAVVDVHRGYGEILRATHLIETMYARDGLLDDALDVREQRRVVLVKVVSEIAAIVEDHVRLPALFDADRLLDAPPEVIVGLALPGKDRYGFGSERGGHLVLCSAAWHDEVLINDEQRT